MIIDSYSDLYNGSNDLDDSGDKNDSHDSLRTLFSPAELGGNSPETNLNVDTEQNGLHKQLSENAVPAAGKSKTENSAGKNSISLNFLLGESL
jgi:hypothetical protein